MARNTKERLIGKAPSYKGMKPYGQQKRKDTEVLLFLEEYEAIRLFDYMSLSQTEAAQNMQVSRPTFTRIYQKARNKIAQSLIEGISIRFEGGHFTFSIEWNYCPDCQISYSVLPSNVRNCPFCNSISVTKSNPI